ncbi:hypothetical protein QBC45DRAFT_67733 [Copromyces sp. CBS 386.78]|nr:hypothetical protein QBC45DRAFT_67733 [Copromyces sp. CBS 386.78]
MLLLFFSLYSSSCLLPSSFLSCPGNATYVHISSLITSFYIYFILFFSHRHLVLLPFLSFLTLVVLSVCSGLGSGLLTSLLIVRIFSTGSLRVWVGLGTWETMPL